METVVEVGSPWVLKMSRRTISVSITARKIVISSGMVKRCGLKIPFRATSIIPLEKLTPTIIPRLAIIIMMYRGATLEPMDELRKFTASLLTPTIRSKIANPISITTATKNISTPTSSP